MGICQIQDTRKKRNIFNTIIIRKKDRERDEEYIFGYQHKKEYTLHTIKKYTRMQQSYQDPIVLGEQSVLIKAIFVQNRTSL